MTTVYESLIEQLTQFNAERDRYWSNLQNVVEEFPKLFREHLGLDQPGWQHPSGEVHNYVTLGRAHGFDFVAARSFQLEGNDECELPFILRVVLNPTLPTQSQEIVDLQIKIAESELGYLFSVEGVPAEVIVFRAQASAKNFDSLWVVLTGEIRRQFDPKLFLAH